jgi:APA family basic amino acid/polyamine antiporter
MHKRTEKPLGFWMCSSLVVGNIIGMGIFVLPSALAPFGLNAFIGWAITLAGCLCIAHLFARLSQALPQDDGPYGYTRRAFGNGAAFFVMWCYWVSIWLTNATLVVGIVGYLATLLPVLTDKPWLQQAAAHGLVWSFVLVNMRGARTSGVFQVIATLLKLLPLAAAIALGAYVLLTEPGAYTSHLPATAISFEATAAAATVSLFAMLGVECATIPARQVADPATTIPRATLFGTFATAGIYVVVTAVLLLLLPQAELAKSSAPFVDLFQRYWNADAGRWLAAFVVISGLGALNGWTMIAGEVTVSFANHAVFPVAFKRCNRHGAPLRALLLSGVLASVMIQMNYSRTLSEAFAFLIAMVTAANMPLYLLVGAAVIKLCRRRVLAAGMLLYATALATILYCLWAFYGMGREALGWAIVLGALSLPVFHAMRRKANTHQEKEVARPAL